MSKVEGLRDYELVETRLARFWNDHPHGRISTELVRDGTAPGDVLVFKAEIWRGADEGPAGVITFPQDPPPSVATVERVREAWMQKSGEGVAILTGGATWTPIYGPPDATGYAHQELLAEPPAGRNGKPNPYAPEWTSPYEVAETSAIGRALANLGYAPKGGRPSAEEISRANVKASAVPISGKDGAAEGERSGAGSESKGSAPGRIFPMKPEDCSHRGTSGRYLPTVVIDGQACCPRCGESALIYRESS